MSRTSADSDLQQARRVAHFSFGGMELTNSKNLAEAKIIYPFFQITNLKRAIRNQISEI